MIYLDNGATSFPKPEEVYQAMDRFMRNSGANPGRSGHRMALEAGRSIYETREKLTQLFNIDNVMNIIFTSNATESLNLAIKGLLRRGDHVITSSMEHNSMIRPIKTLERQGIRNTIVQCDHEGKLDPEEVKRAIMKGTKLIAITHASNVTGTLMPIEEIGLIAKENGIPFLVDAAQTAGIYDIDVKKFNISLLAFPGHKGLLGPQGTGGLYISEDINIKQMKEGGTGSSSESLLQPEIIPDRYESGTPNSPGIVGLGAGVDYILKTGIENIRRHEQELTKYMLEGLMEISSMKIYGPKDEKKQGAVISLNIGNEDSSEISYILDKVFNIGTRPGLHCAPLAHRTIGTLEQGTVRFSIGPFNTKEHIDKALDALREISSQVG